MTKVAIVTGGNRGIGFAIVKGLAKVFDGDVFLTARNKERGLAAVKALESEGLKVGFHLLDIDDVQSNVNLANFLKETYGGLDILVNNAGIAFKCASTEPVHVQAKVTINTNYYGVKKTCDALFPLLRDGARVVNVSSSCGFLNKIPGKDLKARFAANDLTVKQLDELMEDFITATEKGKHGELGWPGSTYMVSKVGLSALTRLQQRDMDAKKKLSDVAINHIHPGYVDTGTQVHLYTDWSLSDALYILLQI